MIIISHDLGFSLISDRVLCYSGPNQFEYDTHENLISQAGKYKDMWESYVSFSK